MRKLIQPLEELDSLPSPGTLQEALDSLDSFDFDYYSYDREILLNCFAQMFDRLGLKHQFSISDKKLERFLVSVAKKMRDVPFHNLTHVFNVTHYMYLLIK